MKAWFRLLKSRTLLFFSAVVAIFGFVPVLYLLGLVAWQFSARVDGGSWVALPAALMFADHALLRGAKTDPVLAYIPQFSRDWAWTASDAAAWILSKLHVGVVPAVIGCGVMAVGISCVLRQRVLIRIHKERKKERKKNRVRRIEGYRREANRTDAGEGRREPFIGSEDMPSYGERRVA